MMNMYGECERCGKTDDRYYLGGKWVCADCEQLAAELLKKHDDDSSET